MTKYQTLFEMVNAKYNVSGIKANSNLQYSLQQILKTGEARTGKYTGKGRFSTKSVWTSEVSAYLNRMGIPHCCGNDAPRGGANGEYVRVTMPAFLKITRKLVAEENDRIASVKAEIEARHNAFVETLRATIASMTEEIKEEYKSELDSRLDDSLTGNPRRKNRKHARKATARIIADKYQLNADAVDFIMTSPKSVINYNLTK